MSENMFDIVAEGYYDKNTDKLFLADVDPEDWEAVTDADYEAEQYDDGYDVADPILSRLEAAYGLSEPVAYGPTHLDPYWDEQ